MKNRQDPKGSLKGEFGKESRALLRQFASTADSFDESSQGIGRFLTVKDTGSRWELSISVTLFRKGEVALRVHGKWGSLAGALRTGSVFS